MAEARALVECSGETYRLGPEFRSALDDELEASGIKRAERLDRRKYERERQAYRERLMRRANRIPEVWPSTGRAGELEPDGYIEDLEPVEVGGATDPGSGPSPAPEREIAPDALITAASNPDQFRELAAMLRTGSAPADNRPALLRLHRARRNARRLHRKLDRERGGYERRKDGARMSPASSLRSELRGVSGMGYPEMLRRWKAMGGKQETLEGAISAGSYRLKREPMDFNRTYVFPAVSRSERGAA